MIVQSNLLVVGLRKVPMFEKTLVLERFPFPSQTSWIDWRRAVERFVQYANNKTWSTCMTSRKLAESQPGHARPGADPSTPGVFGDSTDICLPGYNTTTCVAVLLALNDLTQWPYTADDPNSSLLAVCELCNVYSKWEIETMMYTCNINDKAK